MISAALAFFWLDLSRISSGAVIASGLLLAAIWQGALLAAVAALVLRLVPRIPAAARFAVWFAVFTLIAALPFLRFDLNQSSTHTAVLSHAAWLHLDSRWTLAIVALWAAASLLRAITLIAAALRVRTLSRNATPISPTCAPGATTRRAQVCSSADVDRPTVIGFFSPKILIPSWLLEKLTPAELDQVILHEAGHLNRADDWLNLLQKFALVLFPLNPALAWVERRLCFERELACDERVLSALAARVDKEDESAHAATGYASCLATLAEYRLQRRGLVTNLALALGALGTSGRQSELGRRVARILRPAARMKPLHVRLATAGAMLSLLFAATQLERCPQIVSFAAPAPAPQFANLAPSASPAELLPGYRAVAARLTLPAAPQRKSVGDASPRLGAAHSRAPEHLTAADPIQPRAIALRAERTQPSIATPHMVAARRPQPQPELVITRWTVTAFQSGDGYHVVRTSAVFSNAPAARNSATTDNAASDRTASPSPRAAQQISQPISPYAAVPVPGGWLVFQL